MKRKIMKSLNIDKGNKSIHVADHEKEGFWIMVCSYGEGSSISLNKTELKRIQDYIRRYLDR